MNTAPEHRASLRKFAWLSIAAALATIALKSAAYFVTGSVGLLSDALESIVNLVGAVVALAMLIVAARPADEEHAYGHSKAEYFSSGMEGSLIVIAAISIGVAAVERFLAPRPLEQLGLGVGVSVVASLVNLGTALVLRRAALRHKSVTLEANSRHLFTDVWTSAGVLAGLGAVAMTGWERLDPIIAVVVALNIVHTGFLIVRKSVRGLMDTALPPDDLAELQKAISPYLAQGIQYHAVRTRQAGARKFVSLHVLVPGSWTVHDGHQLLEQIEADIRRTLPRVTVFTHLESLDDPASWEDLQLDRFPDI